MKRLLVLLSSGLLLARSAQAQFGVRVGGNLFNTHSGPVSDDAQATTSSLLGYQIGVYYQRSLTTYFALVPEVQFSREQANVRLYNYSTGVLDGSNYHLQLSYVNLPVLVRLTLGPVYVETGPQASLLVGGTGQGAVRYLGVLDRPSAQEVNQVATDHFRRLDAGACLGIGVKLPVGLGLGIRAYQGIIALDKEAPMQYSNIPSSGGSRYRQTLQASLTYQLATH